MKKTAHRPARAALAAVDLGLGFLLSVGLPTSILVVILFGPTPELVAKFSMVLAASFLGTGLAQLALWRSNGHRVDAAKSG